MRSPRRTTVWCARSTWRPGRRCRSGRGWPGSRRTAHRDRRPSGTPLPGAVQQAAGGVRAAERGEDRPSGAQGARCLTSQPCGAAAAEPRERRVRCEASGRDGLPLAVVRDILSQRTLIQRSRPVILKVRHAVLAAQRHGDRRRWGEMYQLARVGCLAFGAFILFVILISLVVPLLALLALAGVVYLFVLLWRSSLSLRTKRAITGMIVYPAGLYFLWRYTRHDQNVKLGALAVTVGATALLSAAPAALFGLVPLMGAGFL